MAMQTMTIERRFRLLQLLAVQFDKHCRYAVGNLKAWVHLPDNLQIALSAIDVMKILANDGPYVIHFDGDKSDVRNGRGKPCGVLGMLYELHEADSIQLEPF